MTSNKDELREQERRQLESIKSTLVMLTTDVLAIVCDALTARTNIDLESPAMTAAYESARAQLASVEASLALADTVLSAVSSVLSVTAFADQSSTTAESTQFASATELVISPSPSLRRELLLVTRYEEVERTVRSIATEHEITCIDFVTTGMHRSLAIADDIRWHRALIDLRDYNAQEIAARLTASGHRVACFGLGDGDNLHPSIDTAHVEMLAYPFDAAKLRAYLAARE